MQTNIGRSSRNKTILAGIAVAGMAFMTSTTYAWVTLNNSKTAVQDESTYGCTLDMYAQDGNVVTTNKWNCAIAKIKLIAQVLVDWPKNNTPTMTIGNRTDGSIFTAGFNLGAIDAARQMTIGFYDATQNYTATPPVATISYSTNPSKEDKALTLNAWSGGVRIFNPANSKYDLVGWRKVDLADGAQFDISCMYRFAPLDPTNPAAVSSVLYPDVIQTSMLRFQPNTAYTAENGATTLIRIGAADKTRYQNYQMPASPDYQHDAIMADGCSGTTWCAYGNGTVAGIEELCLGQFGY